MKESNNSLNFGQRVVAELLWFLCRAVSILPHWFRYYVIADVVYFISYHLCRYRVKVVDKNLRNSFPSFSDKELRKIRRGFYHYLSEVFVSTISLAGGKPQKTILGDDPQQPIYALKEATAGRSWIALTAHYGLWEYFSYWGEFADQALIAVYHPLQSAIFDELFARLRALKNVETVPYKETIRYCLEHQGQVNDKNYILGLIADQNPRRRSNSQWVKFLNQDTIFFDGGEKIALKFKLPVFFVYQRRLSRGRYEIDFEPIYDGEEAVEPFEITSRYVKKLEAVIQENPELWLWSHRRWKHNPNKWKHAKQS